MLWKLFALLSHLISSSFLAHLLGFCSGSCDICVIPYAYTCDMTIVYKIKSAAATETRRPGGFCYRMCRGRMWLATTGRCDVHQTPIANRAKCVACTVLVPGQKGRCTQNMVFSMAASPSRAHSKLCFRKMESWDRPQTYQMVTMETAQGKDIPRLYPS